ncbi:MAG: Xaa-Pro peptidase family protein [Eubacteriales bacterium]|nr:Xaa-Pro peptidase family protein [Eubacteriales bacterium]
MSNRTQRLAQACAERDAQAALITETTDIRYFSEFTGEGCLVISKDRNILITDSRYTEVAGVQAPEFEVREFGGGQYYAFIADAIRDTGASSVVIEGEYLPFRDYEAVKKAAPDVQLVSTVGLGTGLRICKDEQEIALIKKAAQLTDECFDYALEITREGMSEIELATELYYYLGAKHHAEKAFPFIVAAGEHGSMPHAEPGEHVFAKGEMITLDFGAEYQGYKSDMTRTYALGEPSAKMKEIYQIVLDAQNTAESVLKPGMRCADVDAVARDLIAKAGYGPNFGHGLGHGVGLLIHESPRFSRLSDETLAPGMIVTVEPGIYLPGEGGVRIENTCLITETGYEPLFKSDKKMIIL